MGCSIAEVFTCEDIFYELRTNVAQSVVGRVVDNSYFIHSSFVEGLYAGCKFANICFIGDYRGSQRHAHFNGIICHISI